VIRTRSILVLLPIAMALALAGCGKSEEGPDEAMRKVADGLAANQPEVVWDALPPTYQQELAGLVHELGTKMDGEVWAKAFALAAKLCDTLKAKKDFVLANPMLASLAKDKTEQISTNWDPAVDCVLTLVKSDVADVEKLSTLDVRAFLAGTGAALMRQVDAISGTIPEDPFGAGLKKIKNAKLTVTKQDGDTATMRAEVAGEPPEQIQMVRVEGKWISKRMADRWQQSMTKAKAKLAEVTPQKMQQLKPMLLAQMAKAEMLIDQIAAAKTQQEFDAKMMPMLGVAMAGIMARKAAAAQPPPSAPTPATPAK